MTVAPSGWPQETVRGGMPIGAHLRQRLDFGLNHALSCVFSRGDLPNAAP